MAHTTSSISLPPSHSPSQRLGNPWLRSTSGPLADLGPRHPIAVACATALAAFFMTAPALAQTPPTDAPTLGTVTVRPTAATTPASVTGFGDEPIARTPMSVRAISSEEWKDVQARRVSDLIQLDASASDSYNAIGYWDYITLRGFLLEPNGNHRRDGLPISAETSLPLENRERVELLKGTTGIQAGTSAPGGLVNHVIKRPTEKPLRNLHLATNQYGNLLAHVDLGGRFGVDNALGYRLNLAGENMRSHAPGADGERQLAALAMDWRLRPGSLLEVELEHSRRSQPGVPGLSLTGNQLPAANPFTNINQQPWSQPGVMEGLTGSVRYEQAIDANWSWSAHAARQQLKANDFLAYPYGCYDAGSDVYYADRYCPNGDFDLYDYRSLNERRTTDALQWQIKGALQLAGATHHVQAGVLRTRYTERGQAQADNNAAVGTGNIYALPALPADATFSDPYTQRTEHSTEWFGYDRVEWSPTFSTWLGLRHSRIERDSVRTDGSRATSYAQSFTTPWLAATWQWRPDTMLYASTGQGMESVVAPGRSRYTNANQALDPLKSRQWELGARQQWQGGHATATVFSITRPRAGDAGLCGAPGTCTLQMDGDARHRGLELSGAQQLGLWTVDGSAMWLSAVRRNGQIDPSLNGQRPTNVPNAVLRAGVALKVPQVPGLTLQARASHEGQRLVLPDGSLKLPSWTRLDAGLSYQTKLAGHTAVWRIGINNLLNKRYFQESPYQYSHIYLFPAAPRTVSVSLDTSF